MVLVECLNVLHVVCHLMNDDFIKTLLTVIILVNLLFGQRYCALARRAPADHATAAHSGQWPGTGRAPAAFCRRRQISITKERVPESHKRRCQGTSPYIHRSNTLYRYTPTPTPAYRKSGGRGQWAFSRRVLFDANCSKCGFCGFY